MRSPKKTRVAKAMSLAAVPAAMMAGSEAQGGAAFATFLNDSTAFHGNFFEGGPGFVGGTFGTPVTYVSNTSTAEGGVACDLCVAGSGEGGGFTFSKLEFSGGALAAGEGFAAATNSVWLDHGFEATAFAGQSTFAQAGGSFSGVVIGEGGQIVVGGGEGTGFTAGGTATSTGKSIALSGFGDFPDF